MGVIYKKELRSYFNGMMGYIFTAFMLAVIGVYTYLVCFYQGSPVIAYIYESIRFITALLIPLLTMRTMSEEQRQRTDQLLYSSPVSTYSVIIGKFLAALTVYALPLLVACAYPIMLARFGAINYTWAYSAIFGFFLMGGAAIAIGVFLSALTDNQMVAAVMSFGAMLACYLMPSFSNLLSSSALSSCIGFAAVSLLAAWLIFSSTKNAIFAGGVGVLGAGASVGLYLAKPTLLEGSFNSAMNSLAVFSHFDSFVYGVFDLRSVVYFVTIMVLFVFFTVQIIEKRRWS